MADKCLNLDKIDGDPKYGFLSLDSKHGFYEPDGVWWPTATHYIEAKKFDGTQYETIIQCAKTSRQAKRFARERNTLVFVEDGMTYNVERHKVYGVKYRPFTSDARCNIHYSQKDNWNETRKDYLRVALFKKFQHPRLRRKLIETYPYKFQSKDETARILTELRNTFYQHTEIYHPKGEKPDLDDLDLDCANGKACVKIRDLIIRIAKQISKLEGWDRVFSEMVNDAIFNIYPKYNDQTNNIDKMPNLALYAAKTRDLFVRVDPYQQETDTPSRKIANFIFWCTLQKERIECVLKHARRFTAARGDNGSINFDKVNPPIIIPPSRRWYRDRLKSK